MANAAASEGFHDEVVFRRTWAGQREAVFAETLIDPSARRLMLMVTGATPLHDLLVLDRDLTDPVRIARTLMDSGLIERVDA